MYDILIIGGGPAGLTAALYAARGGKLVLVLEKAAFGGQITWAPRVENYPALPSLSGLTFADNLVEQVLNLGVSMELEEISGIERSAVGWTARTESGAAYEGKALIVATGAAPRTLGISRENELVGSGVCFCAVCDGAFYKGHPVAVIGGGDTALQEALFLSDLCSKVYLIHRRASFRGEVRLVEALRARDNVEFLLDSTITELLGERELDGLVVMDTAGRSRTLKVEGLFVAIGHKPDTEILTGLTELDKSGYIALDENCTAKRPGLFVAGDCRSKQVRQLTTATGDGAVAALAACRYVDSL